MRRGLRSFVRSGLILLPSAFFLTACAQSVGPMDWLGPVAGDQAEAQQRITWYLLYLGAAVFVFVEGWLLYNIIKFRRPLGPGRLPPRFTATQRWKSSGR
jgi:heme/copper-type cytochrome/quinol oxidase subunit 2